MTELGRKLMNGFVSELPEAPQKPVKTVKAERPNPARLQANQQKLNTPNKELIRSLTESSNAIRGLQSPPSPSRARRKDYDIPQFIKHRSAVLKKSKKAYRKAQKRNGFGVPADEPSLQKFFKMVSDLFK